MDRRKFIKTGIAAGTLIGINNLPINNLSANNKETVYPSKDDFYLGDKVVLGKTSLTVPLISMGTGTIGWGGASNQTRLGMKPFVAMAKNAYERGMAAFDMAESYGSHPFVAEAIKDMPREEITLLTKIADTENVSYQATRNKIDEYRMQLKSDYIDIILMHCMTSGGWAKNRQGAMEGLTRAKEDGLVKAVGISAHNFEALEEAAESPWVDVILARINPFRSHMDGSPEAVRDVLAQARRNGKGVIGMKIFGEGKHVKDEEREQSLRYALTETPIHSMAIGFQSIEQMDDAIARVVRIRKELGE